MPSARAVEVLVMPGEGIGPETIGAAVPLMRRAARAAGVDLRVRELEVGRGAFERTGHFLPPEVRDAADAAAASPGAAILFGATADEPIGTLRKRYDLFANLRPIRTLPPLLGVSPLRARLAAGVDMLIVRELVSGIYYGRASEGGTAGGRWAAQEMWYGEAEVRRLVRVALELAAARRRRLTFVHKANVISGVFGLWFDVLREEAAAFPGVEVEDVLVDNMAMQMMLRPATFDVIVSTNLFGDILTEVGAGVLGSLGLVPSASLNASGFALYEPAGGTAPDIAGRGVANPIAAILSVAMMCEHTFRRRDVAELLHRAVSRAVERWRTPDIAHPGCETVPAAALAERIDQCFAAEIRGAAAAVPA